MTSEPGRKENPWIDDMLVAVSPALVVGTLFDLGEYPGLVLAGDGMVRGELYRVVPSAAGELFRRLDAFERFDANRPSESLFVRRIVRLCWPEEDAWAYLANRSTGGLPVVESGDWSAYRRRRDGGRAAHSCVPATDTSSDSH